jgi:hypothetical protein
VPSGESPHSWVLRSDGTVYHNGEQVFEIDARIEENDVVVGAVSRASHCVPFSSLTHVHRDARTTTSSCSFISMAGR